MNVNHFKKIMSHLDINFFHKTPLIHQTESSECGLACLAMISGFYGKNIDLLTIRQHFNISSRGTTLSELTTFAKSLDMDSRALSIDLDEIKKLKMPCILHWDFNHFVVLIKAKRKSCILHDPAIGKVVISYNEISKHFTGVAFEVWPESNFKRETIKNKINIITLIKKIHGIKSSISKILLFSMVIETINLLTPVGTQFVMDYAIPAADLGLLTVICLGLLFFILLKSLLSIFRAWIALVMDVTVNIQWKSSLFNHLLHLPLTYFERRRLGDIKSRFGSLDELRSTFTTSIVGAVIDGVMIIFVLIMMFSYNKILSLLVIVFTCIYILLRLLTYKTYRQLSEELIVKSARSASYFMETLYGVSTVKVQGMTEKRSANWLNLEIDSINTGIKITKMDFLFSGANSLVSACDQVIILWVGTSFVISNTITIGVFVAFGLFRGIFSDRAYSLTSFILQLRMMSLHNERVSDIALHQRESEKSDGYYYKNSEPLSLKVSNVSYRYDSQSKFIFYDFSMFVSPGESVAIIGASGTGKTTLIKILCGLFHPTSGTVEINDVDINKIGCNNYYKMIACVMQDDKLFSGSIRDNICGFTDHVDELWMLECAKKSHLHDVIMKMPMGYETIIGELGEGLSGGQKQRLFIARAIYKKPGILFMDEATSALDEESEKAVNSAISELNITRVIIAHRKSTIESADRIIKLDV